MEITDSINSAFSSLLSPFDQYVVGGKARERMKRLEV